MKKCPSCGYEGEENACPTCQEALENKCEICDEADSSCTCGAIAEEEEETEES